MWVNMSDTMRAVVIANYGGSLEFTRRPMPRPAPGEVLIHVRASGLCSTDLHLLSGRQPLGVLPRIVGHELAGEMAELGEGVTQWRVGRSRDRSHRRHLRQLPALPDRRDPALPSMRRIGFERDGGHADYVAVPAANLVGLPA